ncbi:MAG: mannosyl-3-phosphoglycerate phosphatase [Phyllobacteriaceae bacterium]|nr:mannosyl-3-phosphoglycerate phosphatase [Phyllobacteriaceae bacterium]MBA91125.1 mannosyl-3-phosphoglycerate phosphatase [Phyllobacteriaceae bacterium]
MIIFTDLDGTLLDHETYSLEAARPALSACAARSIPVIPATSKTAAEVGAVMHEAGMTGPAIVENGAGIAWPGQEAGSNAQWTAIRGTLDGLPEELRVLFQGFGDWSLAEVSARTGLPPDAARRAMERRFSEPGDFMGTAEQEKAFVAALAAKGVSAIRGGRFLTLSLGSDKARRMGEVCKSLGATGPVVALGDAPNDIAMLRAADMGVIVANPAHDPLPPLEGEDEGRIIRTRRAGPAGWNEAVLRIIETDAEQGPGPIT